MQLAEVIEFDFEPHEIKFLSLEILESEEEGRA
jgi:hypothetical protein